MDFALTTPVAIALITSAASLLVAVWTQLASRRTGTKHVELTSELQVERDKAAARTAYEFEARKRLYAECEPLLFQAFELARDGHSRVASLARSARDGRLKPDGSGWLASRGYYFKSTAYMLLAPTTTFKILQPRLTAIDLKLEPRLTTHYQLQKLIFLAFTCDHELGRCVPRLDYTPERPGCGPPSEHRRQGVFRGTLEMLVEALIIPADGPAGAPGAVGGPARSRSLGEFWAALSDEGSDLSGVVRGGLFGIFDGFHPARQPVLWRVLVLQYLLYGVLLSTEHSTATGPLKVVVTKADREKLDWGGDPAGNTVDIVAQYLRYQLEEPPFTLAKEAR